MDTQVNNLLELINEFPDNDTCYTHLVTLRWHGQIVCPHCGHEKVYSFADGKRWKCASPDCYLKFNVKTGTIFENSKIPLRKWFLAIYIHLNHKKGVSSCQLARDLKVSQKCAWFMLGRIREITAGGNNVFSGIVEADESYFGGKALNMHLWKRQKLIQKGTGGANKTMIFGLLERGGEVKTYVLKNPNGETLKPVIREKVSKDSILVTDSHGAYKDLGLEYKGHEGIFTPIQSRAFGLILNGGFMEFTTM